MTRVAAVDCGTNSVRLLVADLVPGRSPAAALALSDVVRENEITRLGQGVDRTGSFDPEAVERTLAVVRRYAGTVRELGAERVRMVATSATRDADNRDVFIAGVRDLLGVEPTVISGDEEARLSFVGATTELRAAGADRGAGPPYLVVDIGGGSTELVVGSTDVEAARSVDVGCVRLTERHFHADPPTAAQVAAATRDVEAAIDVATETVRVGDARTLVGLAGSVTTVAALALGLPAYDAGRIHGSWISRADVRAVTDRLLGLPRAERAALPVLHPGRVDVIAAGALVLATVMDRAGCEAVRASEHDILDGIAYSLAGPAGAT